MSGRSRVSVTFPCTCDTDISTEMYDQPARLQCNLTTPAHFVKEGNVCDSVFDCPDRSDEAGCEELLTISQIYLTEAPKVSKFEGCVTSGGQRGRQSGRKLQIVRTSIVQLFCPKSFLSYRPSNLCTVDAIFADRYHPQHVNACRNETLWREVGANATYCTNSGTIKCNGNFPSFCHLPHVRVPPNNDYARHSFSCIEAGAERPPDEARCPDHADLVFCADTVGDCEANGFYRLDISEIIAGD